MLTFHKHCEYTDEAVSAETEKINKIPVSSSISVVLHGNSFRFGKKILLK